MPRMPIWYQLCLRYARVALLCGVALGCAVARAMEETAGAEEHTPLTPQTGIVSPVFLADHSASLTDHADTVWEMGGIRTNYTLGNVSLDGGLFFSRSTKATDLARRDLSAMRLTSETRAGMPYEISGVSRAFRTRADADESRSDQMTYQQLNYRNGGLHLSGSYADIGKHFAGLDSLKAQMPEGSGMRQLALGTTQQTYTVGYTGIRGLRFHSDSSELSRADDQSRQTRRDVRVEYAGLPGLNFSSQNTTEADTRRKTTQTRANYALKYAPGHGLNFTSSLNADNTDRGDGLRHGIAERKYAGQYTGLRGLRFSTDFTSVANNKDGDRENGLTRTKEAQEIELQLGGRYRLNFSRSTLLEHWEPKKVRRDRREEERQGVKLTGGLGRASQFTLSQGRMITRTGTQHGDADQREFGLAWKEWQQFTLDGSLRTQQMRQTGEDTRAIGLQWGSKLSSRLSLNGKLSASTTTRPDRPDVVNNLNEIYLAARVAKGVQLNSQFRQAVAPGQVETATTTHKVQWDVTPRWHFNSQIIYTVTEKARDTRRHEFTLGGQHSLAGVSARLDVLSRDDTLANDVAQSRREVAYAVGADNAPLRLSMRAGSYGLHTRDADREAGLLYGQVSARPWDGMSMTAGYYRGPLLGAGYLAYRGWGEKPKAMGTLDVYQQADFAPYNEAGVEAAYQISRRLRVRCNQFRGTIDGQRRIGTTEWGLEHRLGTITFKASRRLTATMAGSTPVRRNESWWSCELPGRGQLPAWTNDGVRYSPFSDANGWGLGVVPNWVKAPYNGLVIDRKMSLVNGKMADELGMHLGAMAGEHLFVQGDYQRNPRKGDRPNEIDPLARGVLQITWSPEARYRLYARYLDEHRLDSRQISRTISYGVIGTLSEVHRVHLQYDMTRRVADSRCLDGTAYTIAYERLLHDDDAIIVKYRLNARGFCADDDRIHLEASFRRAF